MMGVACCSHADALDAVLYQEAVNAVVPYNLDSPFGVEQETAMHELADAYLSGARKAMDRHEAMRIARLALTPEQVKDPEARGDRVRSTSSVWVDAAEKVRAGFEDALYETVHGVMVMLFSGPEPLEEAKRDPHFGKKRYRNIGPWPGEIRSKAQDWAKQHAGDLVDGLSTTDANRVGTIVARGIDKGQTPEQVADEIIRYVEDDQMTQERALAIAATETNNALSFGAFECYKAAGATTKDWFNRENACEICQGNDAAGVIPIDAEFPSGHTHPTAHPWCKCFCQYHFPAEEKAKPKAKAKAKPRAKAKKARGRGQ